MSFDSQRDARIATLEAALQQIIWQADADDSGSVTAATIAQAALQGEIRVVAREQDDARRQALLFVADDLRQCAERHVKSAGIESRRLYRKHLLDTARVLNERADLYAQESRPSGERV
jgi:hypothetical protein